MSDLQMLGLIVLGAWIWSRQNQPKKPAQRCGCAGELGYSPVGNHWIMDISARLNGADLQPAINHGHALAAVPGGVGVASLGLLPNWRGDLA